MSAVSSLIAARERGSRESLKALAVALAAALKDPEVLPDEPVALMDFVDEVGAEQDGTWQEVRAARDFGDLSVTEYDYLSAAVSALMEED